MRLRKNKLLMLLIIAVSSNCSSSKKKEDAGISVPQVYVGPIRIRRPSAPPISPNETPGSDVYQRAVEADSDKLECESMDKIITKQMIKKTLLCFYQQKDPVKLNYQLLRHSEPEWVLQVDDETPDCFVEELSHIPLPREVFLLTDHESKLTCVNSRLDLEKDDSLDSVWLETETKMSVVLPPAEFPKSDSDMRRMIQAWILSPFFGKNKTLLGKIVPKKLCQACFQDEQLFKKDTREFPKWP